MAPFCRRHRIALLGTESTTRGSTAQARMSGRRRKATPAVFGDTASQASSTTSGRLTPPFWCCLSDNRNMCSWRADLLRRGAARGALCLLLLIAPMTGAQTCEADFCVEDEVRGALPWTISPNFLVIRDTPVLCLRNRTLFSLPPASLGQGTSCSPYPSRSRSRSRVSTSRWCWGRIRVLAREGAAWRRCRSG